MKSTDDILKGGQKIIESGLKKELRDQGHFLTGKLERSLIAEIKNAELEGKSLDYLLTLDEGIPASEIVVNTDSLATMTKYVELRMGYRGSKAQKVAYLILRQQAKEGMPTKNSQQFSKTGERLNALKNGFENIETELDDHISGGIDEIMEDVFSKEKSETI